MDPEERLGGCAQDQYFYPNRPPSKVFREDTPALHQKSFHRECLLSLPPTLGVICIWGYPRPQPETSGFQHLPVVLVQSWNTPRRPLKGALHEKSRYGLWFDKLTTNVG